MTVPAPSKTVPPSSDIEQLMADAPEALEAGLPSSALTFAGRVLGDYRLLELIARGGMGEVYRAERADGQYEQQVAVKVVRDDGDSSYLLQRFAAERRILAALDHPNLAKLLDAGVTPEHTPFFVMELVDGSPIDVYCEHNKLTLSACLRLFRTVCLVVDYAHRQGVVHRDLKPSNVLVTRDGRVKLVDFGIAKRLVPVEGETGARQTDTAQRALTPEYASPEQVRGEAVTPASDIYSLGVLLYRLLTGASPYAGATQDSYALTRAICETEPQPPSRAMQTAPRPLRRQVQGDLDAVILMALRKEPQRRYLSAEALADDLFRHLEGLPVKARRGAMSYRTGRFLLRHRAVVGAVLLANVALVTGIALASYQTFEANRQRERAERHFVSVRKLANVMVRDMHDAIRVLPGSTPARKLLVDNGLQYLEQLSSEARDDAALQTELATGYRTIGDIQGRPGNSLGDPQGALKSYGRAVALLQPLTAAAHRRDANFRDAQQELASVYIRQGMVLGFTGKLEEAQAVLHAGIPLANELAAADPKHRERQSLRAIMYGQLSQVQMFAGKSDEFLKTSAIAAQWLEILVAEDPNDAKACMSLAASYGTRGEYLSERGADKESARLSLDANRKATALLDRLSAKQPDDTAVARALATTLVNQVSPLVRLGEPRQASEQARRALEIHSVLAAKNPSDPSYRADVARVKATLSEALLSLGEVAESVAVASAAVASFEALPAGVRAETNVLYVHSFGVHQLGSALERRSQLPGVSAAAAAMDHQTACKREREALTMLEGLVKAGFNDPPGSSFANAAREALRKCN